MWRFLACYIVVYVDEKRGRRVGSRQWKWNGSRQKRYPQEQNITNIIEWYSVKMIMLQNFLFSFGIAEHFSSNYNNASRQPGCVTAKAILIATHLQYKFTHTLRWIGTISILAYTLYADISYIEVSTQATVKFVHEIFISSLI